MNTVLTISLPVALASIVAPVVIAWCGAYLIGFRRGREASSATLATYKDYVANLSKENIALKGDGDKVRAEIHAFGQRFAASRGDANVKPRAN